MLLVRKTILKSLNALGKKISYHLTLNYLSLKEQEKENKDKVTQNKRRQE